MVTLYDKDKKTVLATGTRVDNIYSNNYNFDIKIPHPAISNDHSASTISSGFDVVTKSYPVAYFLTKKNGIKYYFDKISDTEFYFVDKESYANIDSSKERT